MQQMPILTLKRLPKYLELLYSFQSAGQQGVSATKLAELTGVHMTQVRKDLAFTGVVGIPKVGHRVDELIGAIESYLNWNDISSCFLLGVGHLGKALLGYQELKQKGLKIVTAFDTDPALAGTQIKDVKIYGMDRFENLCKRLKVHIGILTVPAEVAQEVAERMVAGGIVAIWNFSSVKLRLPEEIIVEDVDMSASLAVLSRRLSEKMHLEHSEEEQSQ